MSENEKYVLNILNECVNSENVLKCLKDKHSKEKNTKIRRMLDGMIHFLEEELKKDIENDVDTILNEYTEEVGFECNEDAQVEAMGSYFVYVDCVVKHVDINGFIKHKLQHSFSREIIPNVINDFIVKISPGYADKIRQIEDKLKQACRYLINVEDVKVAKQFFNVLQGEKAQISENILKLSRGFYEVMLKRRNEFFYGKEDEIIQKVSQLDDAQYKQFFVLLLAWRVVYEEDDTMSIAKKFIELLSNRQELENYINHVKKLDISYIVKNVPISIDEEFMKMLRTAIEYVTKNEDDLDFTIYYALQNLSLFSENTEGCNLDD